MKPAGVSDLLRSASARVAFTFLSDSRIDAADSGPRVPPVIDGSPDVVVDPNGPRLSVSGDFRIAATVQASGRGVAAFVLADDAGHDVEFGLGGSAVRSATSNIALRSAWSMDALPPCNGRWPAMASPPFTAKRRDLNSEVPSEEGARRFLAALETRGVRDAESAPFARELRELVMLVREPDTETVARLALLQRDFPGTQLRAVACAAETK